MSRLLADAGKFITKLIKSSTKLTNLVVQEVLEIRVGQKGLEDPGCLDHPEINLIYGYYTNQSIIF